MPNDIQFEAEEPSAKQPSDTARQEQKVFGSSDLKPNTIVIPLWKGGHISFNPESSVSVFAIMALILLLLSVFFVSLIGIFAGQMEWLNIILTAIGHAITGVVGAIVGSSISSKDKSD